MSTAESLAPVSAAPLSWAEICALHPDEWVCLLDIDHEPDGAIRSARVIAHDRAIVQALDLIGVSHPDMTVVHTWGRPWRTPRVEIADESRDLIRSDR